MNKVLLGGGFLSAFLAVAGVNELYSIYMSNTAKAIYTAQEMTNAMATFGSCINLAPPGTPAEIQGCDRLYRVGLPSGTESLTGTTVWPFKFSKQAAREAYPKVNAALAANKMTPLPPFDDLVHDAPSRP